MNFTEKSTFFPSNQRFTKITKELISRKIISVIVFCSTFPHSQCSNFKNFTPQLFSKNSVKVYFISLNKELYYKLITRKFFEVGVNFRNFHTDTTLWSLLNFLYHLKIISWNQLYSKLFTKEIVFTEIFQKLMIQKSTVSTLF